MFVTLATFIMIMVGWLSSFGLLPIHQTLKHSDTGLRFIQVWIQLAITVGLVFPTTAFIVWFKSFEYRSIFGFYLLILVVQIISEQIVSHVWMSSLVVVISTLYTTFRVWQLWQGLKLMKTIQRQPLISKLASS